MPASLARAYTMTQQRPMLPAKAVPYNPRPVILGPASASTVWPAYRPIAPPIQAVPRAPTIAPTIVTSQGMASQFTITF